MKKSHPIDFDNLPSTWAVALVKDLVVEVRSGKASGRHSLEPPGIVHLRPMNITREGKIDLSNVRYIENEIGDNFPKTRKGDVIFNNTNSTELVGKTSWIDSDAGSAYSNHMTILRFSSALSHRFMAHQIHYLWMTGYFRTLSKQHVNQASVSIRTLNEKIPLVVPPKQEQIRIAKVIETQFRRLDSSKRLLKSSQEKAALYRQSVLRSAASGELAPHESNHAQTENLKSQPASLLLQESGSASQTEVKVRKVEPTFWDDQANKEDSEVLEPLPEGWTWVKIGDVGEVRLGRQRSPKHHTGRHLRPYLRVANVFEDRIDTSDVKSMNFTPEEFEVYRLRHGDILLNEGQSLELVGRPALFRGDVQNACFQNTLIRFRAGEGVEPEFALIVFRHYFHSKEFQRIARWSTNIAHLGLKRFSAMRFPLPPTVEQKRIVAETKKLLSVISVQEQTIKSLIQKGQLLRRSILARAFIGRLVPQDPQERSGKDLLAEIRLLQEKTSVGKVRHGIRVKSQRVRGAMPPTPQQPIYDTLVSAGGTLASADLFERCGFDDQTIDDFYECLKAELKSGRIRESRQRNSSETDSTHTSYIEIVK